MQPRSSRILNNHQYTKEELRKQDKIEIAKNLMDILDNETIALKTGLSVEEVAKIRVKN